MTDVRAISATRLCSCGAAVRTLRLKTTGTKVLIPVDIDRVPDGPLTAVRIGTGWGVEWLDRQVAATTGGHRYSPHWLTCSHPAQYESLRRRTETGYRPPVPAHLRAGPCSRCHGLNPHRYGDGLKFASPWCPTCLARVETNGTSRHAIHPEDL